jgi:putative endonuclease
MKISNPTARLGEDLAAKYLQKKGFKIIERNFRRSYGEIDIIAVQGRTLVFVEVKTRTSDIFGTPIEQIPSYKMHALVKTVEYYKVTHKNLPELMRIDAIGITLDSFGGIKELEHKENITL